MAVLEIKGIREGEGGEGPVERGGAAASGPRASRGEGEGPGLVTRGGVLTKTHNAHCQHFNGV